MQNQPPNEEFQFDDFYYKPSTKRPKYHLLQLQRRVSSILIDYEDFGAQENQHEIQEYFQDIKNPILDNIFSKRKPSEYSVYNLYIYDRGTANSRNSELGKILTEHILYCSSVFEREDMRNSLNTEDLEISSQAYQQCVEWIRENKVLAHLKDDLIEYLTPYVHERYAHSHSISIDKDGDGIITFRKNHSTMKKNEAMKILNIMAKGPVDLRPFGRLRYNFRFGM